MKGKAVLCLSIMALHLICGISGKVVVTQEKDDHVTLVGGETLEEEEEQCPEGWEEFNGSCYQISGYPTPWNFARDECIKSNSHLVIINNEEENEFVQSLAAGEETFLGFYWKKDSGEEIYVWVEGQRPGGDYTNWVDGEPTYDDDVGKAAAMQENGEWKSLGLQEAAFYVCESELNIDDPDDDDCIEGDNIRIEVRQNVYVLHQ